MRVLSFPLTPAGIRLFEVFWVGYVINDLPSAGEENKASLRLERQLMEGDPVPSVPGGSVKLARCPGCGSGREFENRRTLNADLLKAAGATHFDLKLEQREFNYVKSRFAKWVGIPRDLRNDFDEIDSMITQSESKDYTSAELEKMLKDREKLAAVPLPKVADVSIDQKKDDPSPT